MNSPLSLDNYYFLTGTAYQPWLSSGDDIVNDNDESKDTDKDKYTSLAETKTTKLVWEPH